MQPEDIDKLFRNQLQHHAPVPPAYLWQQLEADLQPTRKRPAMWLYAAAAMLALLIVAGGTWLVRTSGLGDATGTLAGKVAAKTTASEISTPAKKSASAQATAANELSSSSTEGPASAAPVASTTIPAAAGAGAAAGATRIAEQAAVARTVARQAALPAKTSAAQASSGTPTPTQALVAAPSSPAAAHPERLAEPAVATLASTPVLPAPTGAIEVEVHRGTDAPVALAAADAPQYYESDSHLKNLFHKAKTAVQDGRVKLPKVELPETVTVQVNVFSHSATKVIQL